jgi:Superinfection immunity protein
MNEIIAVITLFAMWAIVLGLYFMPGMIAHHRGHRQMYPIMLVNVFLGWTILGWIIALVWSATAQEA